MCASALQAEQEARPPCFCDGCITTPASAWQQLLAQHRAAPMPCRRWDLRAPTGPEGEWMMEVAATRDIGAGEEVLLSYGEPALRCFALSTIT